MSQNQCFDQAMTDAIEDMEKKYYLKNYSSEDIYVFAELLPTIQEYRKNTMMLENKSLSDTIQEMKTLLDPAKQKQSIQLAKQKKEEMEFQSMIDHDELDSILSEFNEGDQIFKNSFPTTIKKNENNNDSSSIVVVPSKKKK